MKLVVLAALVALAPACKGETKVKDRPETLQRIANLEQTLKDKEDFIKLLNKQISDLKVGGSGQVTITLQAMNEKGEPGAIAKISGTGPTGLASGGGGGNAADGELYESFRKRVRTSLGATRRCYQNELKKDSKLANRSVSLTITVDYAKSGEVSAARFNPRLSAGFASCMRAVSSKWKLPAMPSAVSFRYQTTLVPE